MESSSSIEGGIFRSIGNREMETNETKMDVRIDHFSEKVNGAYDNKTLEIDESGYDKSKNDHLENGAVKQEQVEEEEEESGFSRIVFFIQSSSSAFYRENKIWIWRAVYLVLALLYFAYFGYCMYYEFGDEGSIRLLVCTILAVLYISYDIIITFTGGSGADFILKGKALSKISKWIHRFLIVAFTIFAIVYIIVDIALKTPRNLISLAGLAIFILLFFVFSFNPAKVRWRPVFWGLAIQFIFALLILRTDPGFQAFEWLGDRVQEFLAYSDAGAIFVFGEEYERHFFAFKVLPVIVFFSTVTSILYYLGVMQFIIKHIARFMAMAMGTSPTESLNAAGNIFLGQVGIHRFLIVAFTIFAIVYIIVDIALKTPRNLISLAGLAIFILLFFVFSFNPAKVRWRPVFWGLAIQFIFALLILRTDPGFQAFEWLGDRVQEFLAYSDAGAIFVFGEEYERHFFAFKVLPVIVFFSTVTSILYYLGVMQFIIKHIARFMAMAMGTSPTESLNAAGNIFLGQSEAPLMIRPFLPEMTVSELHAVCTGGFATIAGSVLAAYILYGVPANHLLSASVMSAPAALAMSKLFWPETETSKAKAEDVYNMKKGNERNIVEAASIGASQSIKLVANVAVNVMAFIALLEFVNFTLKWFGERAGLNSENDPLTFQFICSYVFWPIAFFMGVDTVDCRRVAEMIGIKTFINEFVAYTSLSVYINNQLNLTWYEGLRNTTNNATGQMFTGEWYKEGNDIHYRDLNITLKGGLLEQRSVVISTYALCGFSNIGSIGVMLGALGAMAPSRKSDLSRVVIRAMIAGNVACFMTACIAGLLYEGEL